MKFVNTISFRVSLGELEMTLLFSSLQGISWILYVTKEKRDTRKNKKKNLRKDFH